jgi:uncharacterized protein YegP (UPF0339 family)
MKNPKIIIHKSDDGQTYFTVTANNGEIRVTSETHTQKHNTISAILGLLKDCAILYAKHKLGIKVIEDLTK